MMTKCSWKNCGLGLFIGLLFMSITTVVWAEDTEKKSETTASSSVDKGSNVAAEADVELFVGALKLGKASDTKVLDELESACNEAKKKVDEKDKEIAKVNAMIARSSGVQVVGTSITGYTMSLTTQITNPADYEKYTKEKARLEAELEELVDAKNRACQEADEAKDAAEGDIYVYTGSDGSKIFFQYDKYSKTAKVLTGSLRGCAPLPMKLAEGRSCIFCPVFLKVYNAVNIMSTKSYGVLATGLANVMLIGFAIWIAFSLIGKVSSFTKMDAPKYITELLTQIFKVVFAYVLLRDAHAVYDYALGPLLKAGMEFGMVLLSGSNEYLTSCKSLGVENMPVSGLLPSYLYTQLECFIKAVQAELASQQAIGTTLMCVAFNAGGTDVDLEVKTITIPNLSMLFEGIVIWLFAWLLSLAFAFYLIDATVRLGIVGALMPFLIVSWPFKITSKYTTQGFTMFMNTFFTYVFMGLVVSINIQLIGVSMSGAPGGREAVEAALNSNQVTSLKEMLDIGFAGFLILIASCIFGFKICMQATELAGNMAGGGGGTSIAPELGGMGYNVAKAATLGAAGALGEGAKFVGTATGATEKLRKFRDNAVDKLVAQPLARVFSLGRSGGAGKRQLPSQQPQPKGGSSTPTTSAQQKQASDVANAGPRTTQQTKPTPASTTKPTTANDSTKPATTNVDGASPVNPNEAREQEIDKFNRSQAAGLDLLNNSESYRQISNTCKQATSNRNTAAQHARSFENQAKEERDKASALREKAQSMADGAEKDTLLNQAGASDQKANDFASQAAEERNKERENDKIVQETLKQMERMQKEREQNMSNQEMDDILKKAYGENYRAEQSANLNGWNFK